MPRAWKNVSDTQYAAIRPTDRIVMTGKPTLEVFEVSQIEAAPYKPGLWYGIGTEWIDWVRGEMPRWERDYVFRLQVDLNQLRVIRTPEELLVFDREFGTGLRYARGIDWLAVANEYAGIEIAPYFWDMRMDPRVSWYYGWDVASGCVWDPAAVLNVEQVK